jgi:hypothetical protein
MGKSPQNAKDKDEAIGERLLAIANGSRMKSRGNGKRKKEQESGKKKEKILARSARKFQMSAKWKTKIRGQDNERKELRIAVG